MVYTIQGRNGYEKSYRLYTNAILSIAKIEGGAKIIKETNEKFLQRTKKMK